MNLEDTLSEKIAELQKAFSDDEILLMVIKATLKKLHIGVKP